MLSYIGNIAILVRLCSLRRAIAELHSILLRISSSLPRATPSFFAVSRLELAHITQNSVLVCSCATFQPPLLLLPLIDKMHLNWRKYILGALLEFLVFHVSFLLRHFG